MANNCPINGDNHRYFVHSTKTEFTPIDMSDVTFANSVLDEEVYRRIEIAILGCNCGSVIKSIVKDNSNV